MVGINAKNKDIIDGKYICSICFLILQDPVQLITCGHRQCQSCFNAKNEVTIKCPRCQTEMPRHQVMIDRGFKSDMQSLPIECSLCPWAGTLLSYQEHLDQSHPNPKCEYCDEQFDSVNKLNEHKLLQCEKVTTTCILKDFGCNKQIIRGRKEEHYLIQQHQEAAMKVVNQMRSQLLDTQMDTDLSRTTTTTSAATNLVTSQLQEIYDIINILSGGIETLSDDGQRLSNESLQMQIQLQTVAENFSQIRLSTEESRHFLEGVKQNQDILNQDLLSVKDKITDMQYVSYDGTFVWKITNFKEKMGVHDHLSTWPASNRSMLASPISSDPDAQSERRTSIYSPPFYSSPTGYKMRLRLYLHGDGNARRTHVSLFFVLMRGLNDAILKFPFSYKVTFGLYDQTPEKRHIIDSFRPDIRSNSFQRPRSDMNIASGVPKFCPLAMVEEEGNAYVRDDTMFIKVMVDFGDMPKTLLPYAFGLNPGLPTYLQQMMINQEAERRAQERPTEQQVLPIT